MRWQQAVGNRGNDGPKSACADSLVGFCAVEGRQRRRWERPTLVELPRLTELTLQTEIPGACDCPGAGSVVIP